MVWPEPKGLKGFSCNATLVVSVRTLSGLLLGLFTIEAGREG